MGKRYVDHESTLDAPTNKKRKTGSSHQHNAAAAANTTTNANHTDTSTIEYNNVNQSETADANTTAVDAAAADASDVTYSLTTDLVDGVVLTDLCAKKWRCGKPIGKSVHFGNYETQSRLILR